MKIRIVDDIKTESQTIIIPNGMSGDDVIKELNSFLFKQKCFYCKKTFTRRDTDDTTWGVRNGRGIYYHLGCVDFSVL